MQENSGLYFTQQKLSLDRSNEALFCAVAFSLPISCAACDYLERGPFFILTLLLKLQSQKLCSYSLSKNVSIWCNKPAIQIWSNLFQKCAI